MKTLFYYVGLIAACVMPLFNIPLILHIIRRKSSDDLNLIWVFGVWTCIILMTPSALMSPDMIFRVFAVFNLTFFSAVVFVAFKYRSRKPF
jgi:uncharacterized protein with PQ loop repeat